MNDHLSAPELKAYLIDLMVHMTDTAPDEQHFDQWFSRVDVSKAELFRRTLAIGRAVLVLERDRHLSVAEVARFQGLSETAVCAVRQFAAWLEGEPALKRAVQDKHPSVHQLHDATERLRVCCEEGIAEAHER